MYIMCVCLFSALRHRVGTLQISIIIIGLAGRRSLICGVVTGKWLWVIMSCCVCANAQVPWCELSSDSDSNSLFTKFYNKESVLKAVSIQS